MEQQAPSGYAAPRSIADAVHLIKSHPNARVLAGGTDLLVQYRSGSMRTTTFVDVKRIPELIGIQIDERGVRIGAATPAAVICEQAEVGRLWPGLVDAVKLIGSAQIQGRGTIGGNLCNASPAADTTSALIVNEAQVVIAGPDGERIVPVESFCTGPGKTVLARGEFVVTIRIPRPAARTADAYLRLIPRSEMDIAVAGAAVRLTVDASGTCTAARVAIAAVAPTALVVADAASALVATRLDERALKKAADAASAAARPIDDKRGTVAYRRAVVGVLTRRAAAIAARRAQNP